MTIGIDARMYSTNFTGIGKYNYELIRNLLRLDTTNRYVIFLNPVEFPGFDDSSPYVKKVMVDAPHYSLAEQTVFLRTLQQEKLDLMHFTHFNAPLLYRGPCLVTIHDLTISFYKGKKHTSLPKRLMYYTVVRSILKKARKIIAVSQYTESDIERLYPFTKGKIKMIYEAADAEFQVIHDTPRLEATRKKYGLDRPFLLYSGNWRNHKNVAGLIRAFAHILKQNPARELLLVITGKEDPYYPEVKELPRLLGIESHVKLVGLIPTSELIDLYNLAEIFVFPSFYEGFGLPILESMACGTPVASSNTSCLPEVGGPEGCVYFDPHNVEEMATSIIKLLDDAPLRQKLIENGFSRIKEFSWEKMARETLAVYNSLVASLE